MFVNALLTAVVMFVFPQAQPPSNPGTQTTRPARTDHADKLAEEFDAAYRADDWRTGRRLAREALADGPKDPALQGRIARALWRAGQLADAERVARDIPADCREPIALRALLDVHWSRGELDRAVELARRLEALQRPDAVDLYYVFNARFQANQMAGLADILRRAEKLADPARGYPENYVAEMVAGVADFLDAVGTQPLNQIAEGGAAPMPALVLVNLPSCDVTINGHGPYRMVIDTGGSVMVALDQTVADEIGLKSLARAPVRGASGKTDSGQALIDDLRIGTIRCRRVMTRVFDVRSAVLNTADGIVGTGIFSPGRMTLDFANGQLIVAQSSGQPGPGQAVDLRLIGDAKLVVPVTLEGHAGLSLLDTGADVVAVSTSRLKELFPDRKVQTLATGMQLGIGSGPAPEITVGSGVHLVFADRDYKNYGGLALDVLDGTLSPVLGIQLDLLVGMPTFRDMKTCTVDFPHCKLWVDWLARD